MGMRDYFFYFYFMISVWVLVCVRKLEESVPTFYFGAGMLFLLLCCAPQAPSLQSPVSPFHLSMEVLGLHM